MKLTLLITLFLTTGFAFSYSENCKTEIELFGDGEGHDSISSQCLDEIKFKSVGKNYRYDSESNEVLFGGDQVFLYTNSKGKTLIQSGHESKISKIASIILDNKNNEIITLSKTDGTVSFYSSTIMGNISPFRVINRSELIGSNDIAVDTKGDELYVLNSSHKSVCIYSRLANSNHREDRRNDTPKRCIPNLEDGVNAIAFVDGKDEIALLNATSAKISFYGKETTDFRQNASNEIRYSFDNAMSISAIHNRVVLTGGKTGKEIFIVKK